VSEVADKQRLDRDFTELYRAHLRDVLGGVAALPGDRREALIMRFALGMDNREISRALGRTEGATKVLIHRAIKQLQQGLDES